MKTSRISGSMSLAVSVLSLLLPMSAPATLASVTNPAVVNGEDAAIGAWPATVALGYSHRSASKGVFCGATLIDPQWIVTAAHCVQGERAWRLAAFVGRTVLTESDGTRVAVRRIVRGPWNRRTDRNDIALLRLRRPVIQPPMAVADSNVVYRAGTPAVVLGWGSTRPSGRGYDDHLQQGTVQMKRSARCERVWGRIAPSKQVCAGLYSQGIVVDSCSGDSGGPLVVTGSGGPQLAGIVSFGGNRCARRGQPGVYTKVAAYRLWILQTIG